MRRAGAPASVAGGWRRHRVPPQRTRDRSSRDEDDERVAFSYLPRDRSADRSFLSCVRCWPVGCARSLVRQCTSKPSQEEEAAASAVSLLQPSDSIALDNPGVVDGPLNNDSPSSQNQLLYLGQKFKDDEAFDSTMNTYMVNTYNRLNRKMSKNKRQRSADYTAIVYKCKRGRIKQKRGKGSCPESFSLKCDCDMFVRAAHKLSEDK